MLLVYVHCYCLGNWHWLQTGATAVKSVLQLPARFFEEAEDRTPHLVAVNNGVVDLKTLQCHPFTDYKYAGFQYKLPVRFNPSVDTTVVEQFVRALFNDDMEAVEAFQLSMGVFLVATPSSNTCGLSPLSKQNFIPTGCALTREKIQRVWIHHGDGSDGKSTWFNSILPVIFGAQAQQKLGLNTIRALGATSGINDELCTVLEQRAILAVFDEAGVGYSVTYCLPSQLYTPSPLSCQAFITMCCSLHRG